jgi:hypothetical protein
MSARLAQATAAASSAGRYPTFPTLLPLFDLALAKQDD